MLGYQPLDAGPELTARGACWFEGEDGAQIHLSQDPEHRAAARAHVAVAIDDLEAMRQRLDQHGVDYTAFELTDVNVLFCVDPAGNRWELRAPVTA